MSHFLFGSRSTAVKTFQRALLALGKNPGKVDGVYGRRTHVAVIACYPPDSSVVTFELRRARSVSHDVVADILERAAKLAATDQIKHLGLWITSSDWRSKNARKRAALFAELGVTDVWFVLNDNSNGRTAPHMHLFGDDSKKGARAPTQAGTERAIAGIKSATAIYESCGLTVHYMTWLLPTFDFLRACGAQLGQLVFAMGQKLSFMADTEESYVKAQPVGFNSHADAAHYANEVLGPLGTWTICPYAAFLPNDHIVTLARQPFVEGVCNQCYATSSSRARPKHVQLYGRRQFRKLDEVVAHPLELTFGGPLYRQKNSDGKGMGALKSMILQFDTARKMPEVVGYVLWASWDIRRATSAQAKFVRYAAGFVNSGD